MPWLSLKGLSYGKPVIGSMPLLFIAESAFFKNYIKILDNKHNNIDINDIPYKLNRKIYYFPQGYLALVSYIKKGKIVQALKTLANIITAKEGIFRIKNPIPFVNYLKSLLKRK